eukprot:4323920-Ditylum_brightwellii.AAC.1
MRLNQRKNGNAVSHSRSYGLIFGWGHDIGVCDNANSNIRNFDKGVGSYVCPAGQTGNKFLT